MPEWHESRTSNANQILDCCEQFPDLLRVPRSPSNIEHAWYKCYVFVRDKNLPADWNRDRIIEEINQKGIPCFSGSCSEIYKEKAFDGTGFRPRIDFPIAKNLGKTSLMFLVHPTLTQDEIDKTCDVISEVLTRVTSDA